MKSQKGQNPGAEDHETSYRVVVEDLTELVSRVTADGTLVFVNEVACRFFGRTREELLGSRWQPRAVAEDVPQVEARLRTLSPDNPVVVIENRIYSGAGEVRWMQFVNRAFFDAAGHLVEMQAVGRDITERKQAEAALSTSEERLRVALNTARVAVFNQDLELRYVWTSQSLFGRTVAEIKGRTDRELLPADAAARLTDAKRRVLQNGQREHAEVAVPVSDETRYFELVAEPLRDAGGTIVGLTGASLDITGQKRMEQANRQGEERLRLVLEALSDAVWDWDLRTGIAYLSPRYYEWTGYVPGEVVPDLEFYRRIIHPDDLRRVLRSMTDHLEGRSERSEIEYRMIGRDGSVRWVFGRGRVIERDPDGRPLRMLGTITDISERKTAEHELGRLTLLLSHAEEDERSRIARDLHDCTGQKLASLSMTVGLLSSLAGDADARTKKLLDDGLTTIEECAQEIRTLSYLLHPPLLDEMGLTAALAAYVGGFAVRSGIRVDFEEPRAFGRLPAAVELALFRIVQEGLGNIHRHAGSPSAQIRLWQTADRVTLELKDCGGGMPARRPQGTAPASERTGVGLAGMRERLRLLGGWLDVESGEQGTTLRAVVPLRQFPA